MFFVRHANGLFPQSSDAERASGNRFVLRVDPGLHFWSVTILEIHIAKVGAKTTYTAKPSVITPIELLHKLATNEWVVDYAAPAFQAGTHTDVDAAS